MTHFLDRLAESEAGVAGRVAAVYAELRQEHSSVQQRRAKLDQLKASIHDFAASKRRPGAKESANRVLRLSFGGEAADVRASTLTGMMAEVLSSGMWDPFFLLDRDSRIYLDFEAAWIEPVIEQMRAVCTAPPDAVVQAPLVKPEHSKGYRRVVQLFGLDRNAQLLSEPSKIESLNENLDDLFGFVAEAQVLPHPGLKLSVGLKLLYRMSRDGTSSSQFHKLCDGRTKTVTVVQDSNSNVFGGYADYPWNRPYAFACPSAKSFLFTLTGSAGTRFLPHKMPLPAEHDRRCNSSAGPEFGNSHLCLGNPLTSGSSNLGTSFTSGIFGHARPSPQTFKFTAVEVEVYEVVTSSKALNVSATPSLQPFAHSLQSIKLDESPFSSFLGAVDELSHVVPQHVQSFVMDLIQERRNIAAEEEALLAITKLTMHLFLKPLSELESITAASSSIGAQPSAASAIEAGSEAEPISKKKKTEPSGTCDQIEALFREMQSLLQERESCEAEQLRYFNVGGKKIVIRRDTLVDSLAGSSLAAAASNPCWVDQEDDLIDGHVFLDVPRAAFLAIIAFARLKALRGASEILIERENEGALKHLLDYLGLSGHKHKVF